MKAVAIAVGSSSKFGSISNNNMVHVTHDGKLEAVFSARVVTAVS